MDKELIEQLAREAGAPDGSEFIMHAGRERLERFASLIRAHTLEEAAKVCENTCEGESGGCDGDSGVLIYAEESARAIRALIAK